MKVLIADFDLFATTGGGQAFYRAIIKNNPAIQFSYFSVTEPANAERPSNAHALPFREKYSLSGWDDYCDLSPPRWLVPAFVRANNIASSLQGLEFDVIDLPDYEHYGTFLRPALAHHQVGCKRIALSLHGRLSATVGLNWGTEGQPCREIAAMEDLQYQTVDLRYGLSHAYLDEWKARFAFETHYLSPLRFLHFPQPTRTQQTNSPPDLQFIGRTEKCKGPDLFVELAWWLPADSYGRAIIVGPQTWDPAGVTSSSHLRALINNRIGKKKAVVLPPANRSDLARLFASRALTVLPSRFDTLNFVALESLFAGCPTAIGDRAGACRFLEETFPQIPFVKIEIDNWHGSLGRLASVLQDYDRRRDELVDALERAPRKIEGASLAEIYGANSASARSTNRELDEYYDRLMNHQSELDVQAHNHAQTEARTLAKACISTDSRRRLRRFHPRQAAAAAKTFLKHRLENTWLRNPAEADQMLSQGSAFVENYRQLHHLSERTDADLGHKAARCGELLSSFRADRIRLWRELARIESLRGNNLAAATYRLRALRMAGGDPFHDLPLVKAALDERGFHREAETAEAMFGDRDARDERCGQLLEDARQRHLCNRELPFEFIDDRRNRSGFKTSIIVSLYNAADKLPMFLRALSLQTLFQTNQAEIILVDSGSPANEYAVFQQLIEELRIPIVYARSARRETIQSAWNRGIALSRAEYLSFLGVDEAILPPALEILADELDADPTLDWVQANSLMTNVSERGQWLNDIMSYDRVGYSQSLVYLDTCYLSWVGALYRRNLHDRCGFYDSSFGAAGDTEFKNRVLPFIKTKVLPRTLGIFWNYPSGQTTASPRAEIEDLRAWYLHRTLAGVRYAFGRGDPVEAEDLLYTTLRYRKSYCRHWSTDVEYAFHLATFLKEQNSAPGVDDILSGLGNLLGAYRSLDFLPQVTATSLQWSLSRAFYVAQRTSRRHYDLSGERVRPAYQVFNDNRHEQHTNLWSKAA